MTRRPVAAVLLANTKNAADLSGLLDSKGIQPQVVQSTDELHRTVNQECIDLVVIENGLQGFLSGIEVLERMRQDLLRPGTILLADVNAALEQRCRRLGIERLLPARTPVQEIATIAQELVALCQRDRVVIPEAARKLVQKAEFINPLPQLLVRLTSYMDRADEEDVVEQFGKDVSVDARVTAELLKLTNSSAMGRALKTTNVFEAVRFLGVRRSVAMVLSAGIFRAQGPIVKTASPTLRTWYNQRSVLIGSTAASFAESLENVSAPTAYLLGLMQDIGSLVLGHVFGARYDELLARVRKIAHLRREVVEANDFNTTHAEVSAALLQKWDLPASLVSMVLHHHDQEDTIDRAAVDQAFSRAMRIGERVADLADARSPRRYIDLNQSLSHYGRERAQDCKEAMASAIKRAVESSKLFCISIPDGKELEQLVSDLEHRCEMVDRSASEGMTDKPPPRTPVSSAVESASSLIPESHTPEYTVEAQTDELADTADNGDLRSQPTILIVDDEASIRAALKLQLRKLELSILDCGSGESALVLANQADLVLCDVHLGDMSGTDLVAQLRANGYHGKIVMISGDDTRQTVSACAQLLVDDYLLKPVKGQRLVEKVCQHLHITLDASAGRQLIGC